MIQNSISAYLECLQNAQIKHSLFISQDRKEIHLWDEDKLQETLQLLESRGVKFNSILKAGEVDTFYIISF